MSEVPLWHDPGEARRDAGGAHRRDKCRDTSFIRKRSPPPTTIIGS